MNDTNFQRDKRLRPLPLGRQTFSTIIEANAVYIDKTAYFYRMIDSYPMNQFFFSRPRRFGKSLTISTLDAIFSGKKELFTGLYIAEKTDYDFKEYPVLRFDFSNIGHGTAEELNRILMDHVGRYGEQHGAPKITAFTIREAFEKLVAHFKTQNQKIVILIDEYDKPILDHITNIPVAQENRDVLKGFYEIIKANDESIRFVFITGITKFSQMNIFSGMNNLRDISLDEAYAGMCGYTQKEMGESFEPHLKQFSEAQNTTKAELLIKIKMWYNGFRFTEAPITLYNPFSTLLLLDTQKFQYHWFATGTPTYLMDLIREHRLDVTEVEGTRLSPDGVVSYNLDSLKVNIPALLFQTGYLTVSEYVNELFVLKYPNLEVREAFSTHLLDVITDADTGTAVTIIDLREALTRDKVDEVMRILQIFFSKIPYDIQEGGEKYYQTLFYLIFTVIGTRIHAEVRTNKGRIDAVVETKTHVYVFEFKLDAPVKDAMAQIDGKDYAFSYQDRGKVIRKVGVSFSTTERNIVAWEIAGDRG